MGAQGSKNADTRATARAVGITGGGAMKRLSAPKLPNNATRAAPEDYIFIEVSPCMFYVFICKSDDSGMRQKP
jgi:hypothetical protein